MLASLGMAEEVVNAATDHDQPRPLPETIRTLADVVYVANLLAGAHMAWSADADASAGERVLAAREVYADLLPEIDTTAKAMLSVFS